MDLVNKLFYYQNPSIYQQKNAHQTRTHCFIEPTISALSLHTSVIGYKLHVDWGSAENIQVTKHSIKTQLMIRMST